MSVTGKLFLFLFLAAGFSACFEPPSFPKSPVISNARYYFVNVPDTDVLTPDSLNLTIHFTDGDGDDGLSPDTDDYGIFTNRLYFTRKGFAVDPGPNDVNSKYVTLITPSNTLVKDTLLAYSDYRLQLSDTLKPYVSPWSCTKWEILRDTSQQVTDTVYKYLNPYTYNMLVDFMLPDPANPNSNDPSTYIAYDWASAGIGESCQPFGYYGRFPVLSKDLSKSTPLEGDIFYGMNSIGWRLQFGNTLLALRITILDRALHRSNTITTPAFRLDDITK